MLTASCMVQYSESKMKTMCINWLQNLYTLTICQNYLKVEYCRYLAEISF